jgi:hypothetical protein
MGVGDAVGLAGSGAEIYAIAVPGATIAGVSAVVAGLALAGVGVAVASGISMSRAIDSGDTTGAIAGGLGVAAGLAITAGAIGLALGVACAPVLLAVGIIASVGVGVFQVGRHFSWRADLSKRSREFVEFANQRRLPVPRATYISPQTGSADRLRAFRSLRAQGGTRWLRRLKRTQPSGAAGTTSTGPRCGQSASS